MTAAGDGLHNVDDRQTGDRHRVSASISTPVRVGGPHRRSIETPSSSTSSRRDAVQRDRMAQRTRSGVRFAAMIPAIRATDSASPLGSDPSRNSVMTSRTDNHRPRASPCALTRLGRDVDIAPATVIEVGELLHDPASHFVVTPGGARAT